MIIIYVLPHQFTQEELSVVKPEDIVKWMTKKLYDKYDPGENEKPTSGSHHTIDYYKKSIR